MKSLFSVLPLLLFCTICIADEPIRTWTSSDGKRIEARFVGQSGTNITIKNSSGQIFTLPLTRFSQNDQEYAEKASLRAVFRMPEAFEGRGKGGMIIASAKGNVSVVSPARYDGSRKLKSVTRAVIVGESIPHGTTILTKSNSEANLLLTNGTLAKVGPNSKLILSAFWQKNFRASTKKVSDLMGETSPSRVALKLVIGDLVVDVKKLNRESSFVVESPLGVAGIRGTKFGFSSDSKSTGLSVLEGKVAFQDSKKQTTSVETSKKIVGTRKGAGKLIMLPEREKADLAKTVVESQKAVSKYDVSRLSNTVEGYSAKSNYLVKSALDMELIWCPPGSYLRGAKTTKPVILTEGFYLGKYEVTQEEYEIIVGKNPSKFKTKKLPVENVSWNDAIEFCNALNLKERAPSGWKFSLPTEAQWEYACRAGTTTKYHWGDEINPNNANYQESKLEKTRWRGSYRKNPWGFYDMHGNVWEWCLDWYGTLNSTLQVDPYGSKGTEKILKGGSFSAEGSRLSPNERHKKQPDQKRETRGFRISLQKK